MTKLCITLPFSLFPRLFLSRLEQLLSPRSSSFVLEPLIILENKTELLVDQVVMGEM